MQSLIQAIENAWENKALLHERYYQDAVEEAIALLDQGKIRCAQPNQDSWEVIPWVKKAILLYFLLKQPRRMEAGIFSYYDKIPLKNDFERIGVRVVPPATVRYGSYIAPGVVLMPSYVNIGAYVDEGTMVDTWATVGSCAQIGKHVHLSGGVGIGGVLEPPQAKPVIIEDHVFIGSRSVIVEGVHVKKEAVIAANVTLTASTKIIDVTQDPPKVYQGVIPPRSVVVPGTYEKKFQGGTFHIACALIIGQRKASTDKKTALNEALRTYGIA